MKEEHVSEEHSDHAVVVIPPDKTFVLTGPKVGSLLILLLFFVVMGLSVFVNRLSGTVHHVDTTVGHVDRTVININETASRTDRTVSAVTGPEAQAKQIEAQKAIVDSLLHGMDCQNQQNLQRAIDLLLQNGVIVSKAALNVVEPKCQSPEGSPGP